MKTLLIGGLLSMLSITAYSLISEQPSPPLAAAHASQARAESRDLSEYVRLHVTRDAGAPVKVVALRAEMCRGPVGGVRS